MVDLRELSQEHCIDYMVAYMRATHHLVPRNLKHFIFKLSLGNAMYIREIIDQLIKHDLVKIERTDGSVKCTTTDLDSINIAGWGQTAMVGNTICVLESLDPLEAAVLKMSTCFEGTFTLPDLAASTASRWAGATHFDYLRILRAVSNLVRNKILEKSDSEFSQSEMEESMMTSLDYMPKHLHNFEMKNFLIRKVGHSMVLEAQKKVVKRQALIDRSLSRDLPKRMEAVRIKRLEPHIPWYYETVMAKGPT